MWIRPSFRLRFLAWPSAWHIGRYVETWTTFACPTLIRNTPYPDAVVVLDAPATWNDASPTN